MKPGLFCYKLGVNPEGREAEDYYPICEFLVSMADVYLGKGEGLTALNYALRSLRLAEQHGLKEQIADASLKLSEIYENAGNTSEALTYYKKHVAYRDSINNIKTVQAPERRNQRILML
jgi:hypothetical protein